MGGPSLGDQRPIVIPAAFADHLRLLEPDRADGWLAALPGRIAAAMDRWDLTADGTTLHGGNGIVLPVLASGEPFALRVAVRIDSSMDPGDSLRLWDGLSTVRLLRSDPAAGTLLLERLDASRTPADLPNDAAAIVYGDLIRLTAIPAPQGVPAMEMQVLDLATNLPGHWERLGRPYSREVVDRVLALCRDLPRRPDPLLINTDLWDDNILAGRRRDWLVIDPRPLAGDPEYGLAQLLWRRVDRMAGPADLDRFIVGVCRSADLNPDLARAWSFVRVADYWLWGMDHGLTEDPVRCRRLLSWLSV